MNEIIDKEKLRKEILRQRDQMDPDTKNMWDQNIYEHIVHSKEYIGAQHIFIFASFRSEPDTWKLIEYAIGQDKVVALPRVSRGQNQMDFFAVSGVHDLVKGYMGIMEPMEATTCISPVDGDLILCPGSVFDQQGNRIGYGGGFYDRYLNQHNQIQVHKMAIMYEFQLKKDISLLVNDKDVRMDSLCTQNNHYYIHG